MEEKEMEMLSLAKELGENAYPGRGIVIGKTKDGAKAVTAYFIMGISISIGIYFQAIEESAKSLVVILMRGIIMPVIPA